MNFVKLFEQPDLLGLEQCQTDQQLHQILAKKGVDTETVATLLTELYQFATMRDYSLQQKYRAINLGIALLKNIPENSSKEQFSDTITNSINNLGLRDQYGKVFFNLAELNQLKDFFTQKILAYYQLYQIILDNHPLFMLEAQPLELVRTIRESALQSGTSVDVETIPALQQYLGIRAPKEEKKDPKKK